MSDVLTMDVNERVAEITLRRPEKMNALSPALLEGLDRVLDEIEELGDARSILVRSEGDSFCVGADISFLREGSMEEVDEFVHYASATFRKLETATLPSVCAIRGNALGGGMELALSADCAVCDPEASFGLPEATLGLLPGGGGTQRLPRLIGKRRAKEMIFTGRHIDAPRALELGIVNEVREDPYEGALQLAQTMAESAPLAVQACKRLINQGPERDLDEALELEQQESSRLLQSEDCQEGVSAFLEKRDPNFKGR